MTRGVVSHEVVDGGSSDGINRGGDGDGGKRGDEYDEELHI